MATETKNNLESKFPNWQESLISEEKFGNLLVELYKEGYFSIGEKENYKEFFNEVAKEILKKVQKGPSKDLPHDFYNVFRDFLGGARKYVEKDDFFMKDPDKKINFFYHLNHYGLGTASGYKSNLITERELREMGIQRGKV